MRMIARRAAAALTAAVILAGCDDPTSSLAPSTTRAALGDGLPGGSTIAYRAIEARCGRDMSAGCGEEGGWGWSAWTSVATIGTDGAGLANLTYPVEDNTLSRTLEPAWSPDGMRVAFYDGAEILVVAGAGGTPLNLTRHAADDFHPTWSPDGSRVAFGSNRGGSPELYVMNAADGSNLTRLTNAVGFAGHPDWSADATRIVFDCVVEPGNSDICSVNADGTGFVRLTSAPGYDGGADWSPAGRIAFATARYGAGVEIATMDGDGSVVARVASGIAGTEPDWSPDGSGIAFTRDLYVYTIAVDGSNLTPLASGTSPSWRPSDAPLPAIAPPVAMIGTTITCLELSCTFDGSGSTDDVGTRGLSFSWSFGDGTSKYESSPTPTHAFPAAGTYTVTLRVTATATGMSSTTTSVTTVTGLPVGAPPVASFTTRCVGLTCTLDGTGSTDDAAVHSYSWDLGKTPSETASGAVVTTIYPTEGSRTVRLTVSDGAGQANSTTRTFYAAPIAGDAPPVARLTVSCVGLQCSYDGSASTDDNLIISFYFDPGFPSGPTIIRSSSGIVVYPAAGTYTMTMTVEDGVGQRSAASRTVTVGPLPPPNQPPVAAFTYTCARTKCTFDGRGSTDDQGIVAYDWNLGSPSGNRVTGAIVTHDYKRAGSYTVRLSVRDAAGLSSSASEVVTVAR